MGVTPGLPPTEELPSNPSYYKGFGGRSSVGGRPGAPAPCPPPLNPTLMGVTPGLPPTEGFGGRSSVGVRPGAPAPCPP